MSFKFFFNLACKIRRYFRFDLKKLSIKPSENSDDNYKAIKTEHDPHEQSSSSDWLKNRFNWSINKNFSIFFILVVEPIW